MFDCGCRKINHLPSISSTLNVQIFCTNVRFGSFYYYVRITRKMMFVRKTRAFYVDEIDTWSFFCSITWLVSVVHNTGFDCSSQGLHPQNIPQMLKPRITKGHYFLCILWSFWPLKTSLSADNRGKYNWIKRFIWYIIQRLKIINQWITRAT